MQRQNLSRTVSAYCSLKWNRPYTVPGRVKDSVWEIFSDIIHTEALIWTGKFPDYIT